VPNRVIRATERDATSDGRIVQVPTCHSNDVYGHTVLKYFTIRVINETDLCLIVPVRN
jgi:hypothetical protein